MKQFTQKSIIYTNIIIFFTLIYFLGKVIDYSNIMAKNNATKGTQEVQQITIFNATVKQDLQYILNFDGVDTGILL